MDKNLQCRQPNVIEQIGGETARLNVTPAIRAPESADEERSQFAGFAGRHGHAWYRERLSPLYLEFWKINAAAFQSQLKPPHLTIGVTPPRVLGFCKQRTDFGGDMQITFRHALFDGSYRGFTEGWDDSVGVKRFRSDVLLHEIVHQYHFEITGKTEPKSHGHGKHFAAECNRIARDLFVDESEWIDHGRAEFTVEDGNLGPRIDQRSDTKQHWRVVTRRRGRRDGHKRLAKYWPHCIRPERYYGPDVVPQCWTLPIKPKHLPVWAAVLENLVACYDAGHIRQFVDEAKKELVKLKDADCGNCVRLWTQLWDEPCCQLEALKPPGLPEHWLSNLPPLLRPGRFDPDF